MTFSFNFQRLQQQNCNCVYSLICLFYSKKDIYTHDNLKNTQKISVRKAFNYKPCSACVPRVLILYKRETTRSTALHKSHDTIQQRSHICHLFFFNSENVIHHFIIVVRKNVHSGTNTNTYSTWLIKRLLSGKYLMSIKMILCIWVGINICI